MPSTGDPVTAGDELEAAAREVLRGNDLGEYTAPSPRLYPHQWNWDSALVAIGWAHLDWSRAVREIESLLGAQWTNGMLPHIRYNPNATDYHPGPEWWPGVPVRRAGVLTSGISQPPVLATAVHTVGLLQPDERARLDWWAGVYDPVRDALLYFPHHRTAGGSPLVAIIHPWESGLDNSPRWDFAVRMGLRPSRPYRRIDTAIVEAAKRPTQADYDLYMHLVEWITADYDVGPRLSGAPFAVYDALFNAAWYRAALDLNRIARALGRPPAVAEADLEAFRAAYHATLWHPQSLLFRDVDLRTGTQIPVDSVAGLIAIYGGLVSADQAAAMMARYRRRCRGCRMVPSVPPDQPAFDAQRYWRGPVWVHVNWLILRGLEAVALRDEAASLAHETVELVRRAGLHEYYDPYTDAGLGGPHFSWPAALVIDLLRRPVT
jgi:hypothetical protein